METFKKVRVESTPNADTPVKSTKVDLPVKFTPAVKLSLAAFTLLLILVAAMSLFRSRQPTPEPIPTAPAASPGVTASLPPREVSEFAKTTEFANFEDDLNQLQRANTTIDLTEAELTFPLLDMKVNFDK